MISFAPHQASPRLCKKPKSKCCRKPKRKMCKRCPRKVSRS